MFNLTHADCDPVLFTTTDATLILADSNTPPSKDRQSVICQVLGPAGPLRFLLQCTDHAQGMRIPHTSMIDLFTNRICCVDRYLS